MGSHEPRIRAVLVSPGDMVVERDAAKRVVDELNSTIARGRLALWRWERDARSGLHTIAIYEPLLADYQRILGTEHPATLNAGNDLADAYDEAAGLPARGGATSNSSEQRSRDHLTRGEAAAG